MEEPDMNDAGGVLSPTGANKVISSISEEGSREVRSAPPGPYFSAKDNPQFRITESTHHFTKTDFVLFPVCAFASLASELKKFFSGHHRALGARADIAPAQPVIHERRQERLGFVGV